MFDATQFLMTELNQANSTDFVLCPKGVWPAQVKDLKPKELTRDGETRMVVDVIFEVSDPNAMATAGVDTPFVIRKGVFLDMTPQGTIDMGKGKNVELGRLREALGMNVPGQPFSFVAMKGRFLRAQVDHRVDPNDSSKVYSDVKGYAKF